ncbi:MAG: hypothetical protein HYS27_24635 [Deltaproteobacteria bacterium]|nr:hypothetical protein [Deltaproteobacteria bacterium]
MALTTATPETTDPPKKAPAERRHLVLLLVTVLLALGGGALTSVAVGALLAFLPALLGVIVGMLLGYVLPTFLALRASQALRRRSLPPLLRRLAVLFLIGATQLAIFGAVLTWSARTTAHLAATAAEALDVMGGVPILSGVLKKHAAAGGVSLKGQAPRPAVGPDGGVLHGPDGGVLASDGGYFVEHPDAGPLTLDGGAPAAKVDAGAAAPPVPPAPVLLPAPPAPKAGVALSPRGPGKPVRTACAALVAHNGDALLAIATLQGGGAVTWRTVELGALDKLGPPTLVECAEDGTTAAILGGTHLALARPGRAGLDQPKALAPGAKLAGGEVQAVRDVAVGPGGLVLAVVGVTRATDGGTEVAQALVALGAKGVLTVLRKSGDAVPGADAGDVVHDFALKRPGGGNGVLVVESYLEGSVDKGVRISGEEYALNPQRLLAVRLDTPKAMTELCGSGVEPSGIDAVHLQAFGDAVLLPDGRALLDANFVEKGPDGWLFSARPAGGVAAIGAELRGGGAAWTSAAPRAQHLDADLSGTALFRRADGAVALFTIDKPAQVSAGLRGAEALTGAGVVRGAVVSVDVPLLARGGGWVLASAQLKDAGGTRDALVLASLADLDAGKAEVLLATGDPVPGAVGTPRTVQSIRLGKGRDELLWRR